MQELSQLVKNRHYINNPANSRALFPLSWKADFDSEIRLILRVRHLFALRNVDDFVAEGAHDFNRLQQHSIGARKTIITITWKQQNSTSSNRQWNLVRDHRVGEGDPWSRR